MRLGFACKVLGAEIPSHDARKWQSKPHLRVSIEYLNRMFDYLHDNQVHMFRMSSDVAPYYTDLTRPEFGSQLDECRAELRALGEKAREYDIRLSTHPGQYVVLNSPDEKVYAAAVRDLDYHALLFELMEQPPSARMILHIGGVYGDREAAAARFVERYASLSGQVRARLVIENDDRSWPFHDVLAVSRETGVPVVFDVLHHAVLNPEGIPESEALATALNTWPVDQIPKIHYSDERTEPREVRRKGQIVLAAPSRGQHADYIEPSAFAGFVERTRDRRTFDVMLETKAKDLALFRLRVDLADMGVYPEKL